MKGEEDLESKLKKLQFYRSEITHEYTLLYNRLGAYTTSQSFLMIAYASGMANRNAHWGDVFTLIFPLFLSLIGIITSVSIRSGVQSAIETIHLWHQKQDELVKNDSAMETYAVHQTLTENKSSAYAKHRRSTGFTRLMPRVFLVGWILFAILTVWLHIT